MADLQSYKKADLVNVCKKLEISTLAKDTKKILTEKLETYIQEHPEDGELTVQTLLEDKEEEDGDEETLAEETTDGEEKEDVDEEDKDYNGAPPIDLKEWIVDPIIEKGEEFISTFYKFTDRVGITTVEFNEELRDRLSTSVTLNYLELAVEVFFFFYTFVPLVAVKEHSFTQPIWIKTQFPFLAKSEFLLPDFCSLFNLNALSVFFTWTLTSVLLPLLIAYYVNFSKRVIIYDDEAGLIARIYKFDPFVFALSKVLVFYFLYKNGSLVSLNSNSGIFNALKNHIAIQLGFYGKFTNFLGNFPIVLGLANVLIAIYSQFEES